MSRVLLDSGPLLALLSQNDDLHAETVDFLLAMRTPTVTCWPVLVEVAWLLQQRREPPELVLQVCETGAVVIERIVDSDLPPIRHLLVAYRDLRLQLADATLLQIADRLGVERVCTFDRRDFLVARTPSGRLLEIVGGS